MIVGYKGAEANRSSLNAARDKIQDYIQNLKDIRTIQKPNDGNRGKLLRKDVDLTPAEYRFWSDQISKEHVQFQAYKSFQKLIRAQEEKNYTQREMLSVLLWCEVEVTQAISNVNDPPDIDHVPEQVVRDLFKISSSGRRTKTCMGSEIETFLDIGYT
jgi:hypothetical protein